MIKNIILDIGFVLVNFRYHDYMNEMGFDPHITDAIEKKIILNELWGQLDLGIRDENEIIEEMKSKVSEYSKETDIFFGNLEKIVDNYDYSRDWIKDLKAMGYNVYLLSNYPKGLFKLHEEKVFNFLDLVDGKVISAFVKLAKPDIKIYEYLLETFGLVADECLFFDDRQENIDGAIAAGLNAHLFTGKDDAMDYINALRNEY